MNIASELFATHPNSFGNTNLAESSAVASSRAIPPNAPPTPIRTGIERQIFRIPEPRQEGEDHDDHQVLHQKDADRDPAVECVQLALLVQELHDHHRAAERQRGGQEDRLHGVEAERDRESEATGRREQNLPQPGENRDPPDIPDLGEAQLETHQKEEQRDPHLGDDLDHMGDGEQTRDRPEKEPREDVGYDGRNPQPAGDPEDHHGGYYHESKTAYQADVRHVILESGGAGEFRPDLRNIHSHRASAPPATSLTPPRWPSYNPAAATSLANRGGAGCSTERCRTGSF
jgi:hypothetical protein